MTQAESQIQKLVEQIVDLVDPLKIILFGSHAREDAGADSDIDLLVVMPDGTHRRNIVSHLYSEIKAFATPFDLVVATESDLIEHRDDVGFIYYYALKWGKIVYARKKRKIKIVIAVVKLCPKRFVLSAS
ncbi:nucleotidyltransferase domain-containing protein [bacterium]|nr:nucleotidyltransferase domain-containing protein [bacterium]